MRRVAGRAPPGRSRGRHRPRRAPAETQAVTGSRLVRALESVLVGRTVVALVTHAQVGAHDPQVSLPDRPRVRPQAVPEAQVVRELLADGTVVVCGGGIPVMRERGTARLRTVPVTVDPDRTAALLAVELDADILLFLTGATHLFAAGGHGRPRPLLRLTPDELSGVRREDAPRAHGPAEAHRAEEPPVRPHGGSPCPRRGSDLYRTALSRGRSRPPRPLRSPRDASVRSPRRRAARAPD
ncbi:hypothetical protein ACIOC1_15305 [Streptomyces sp. NPDC088197]|uniref:amino acid kinase family protein n=1 Tax=Streptomyces sp. NPDC088197 TaxID=3365840 RepID=UPI003800068D